MTEVEAFIVSKKKVFPFIHSFLYTYNSIIRLHQIENITVLSKMLILLMIDKYFY